MFWYVGKLRQNWRDHVNRMDGRRILIQILQCMSWGNRFIGHLAKRLLETVADHIVLTHVWKMMISYTATVHDNNNSVPSFHCGTYGFHKNLPLLLQSALQPLWVLACSTIVEYSQQEGFYRVLLPVARQTPNLEDQWFRTFHPPPQGVSSVWNDASKPQ